MHRILTISGLYPPNVIGGAEMSASNTVKSLQSRGFEMAVLTGAADASQVGLSNEGGIKVYRVAMPRPYPMFKFPEAPGSLKPLWHIQDHVDPRNVGILRRVLDEFRPDLCTVHIAQGIGHNIFSELARRDIPVVYFLHDLGLACIRQSMFKDGQDCADQCQACRLSSAFKMKELGRLRRIGFSSPSTANIRSLEQHISFVGPTSTNLNPNTYPGATSPRTESATLRVLYVGRIHPTKGVPLLLEAVQKVAQRQDVSLTLIGDGPDLAQLREQYSDALWCHFEGFLTQAQISNHIVNSDVLATPSIWAENSPGVVIHALGLGLPVLGSNRGGIPELVKPGENGLLIEAGNEGAWTDAIESMARDPAMVARLRAGALADRERFDPEHITDGIVDFLKRVAGQS